MTKPTWGRTYHFPRLGYSSDLLRSLDTHGIKRCGHRFYTLGRTCADIWHSSHHFIQATTTGKYNSHTLPSLITDACFAGMYTVYDTSPNLKALYITLPVKPLVHLLAQARIEVHQSSMSPAQECAITGAVSARPIVRFRTQDWIPIHYGPPSSQGSAPIQSDWKENSITIRYL